MGAFGGVSDEMLVWRLAAGLLEEVAYEALVFEPCFLWMGSRA